MAQRIRCSGPRGCMCQGFVHPYTVTVVPDLDSKSQPKKGTTMENEEKDARRAAIVAALGTGTEYEDGVVLQWDRTFRDGVAAYTYVAVRVNGSWYISGQEFQALTWEALVERWLRLADSVWIMTASEQIA